MRTHTFKHINVAPDGKVKDGGAVGTSKRVSLSMPGEGGCGLDGCHCSDGHWICISEGRDADTSVVQGITINFDSKKEYDKFVTRLLKGKVPTADLTALGLTEAHIAILSLGLQLAINEQLEADDEEGD